MLWSEKLYKKVIVLEKALDLNSLLELAIESLYLTIIIDKDGNIRFISKLYADIIGIDKNEVLGTPIEKTIPNTRLLEILETGEEILGQIFIMKNGKPTICNRFPIKDKNGKICGALSTATFQDIDKVLTLKTEVDNLINENIIYKKRLAELKEIPYSIDSVIGESPVMKTIKANIKKAADSKLPILITGETGTGKEVFANAIHHLSNRRFNNFVKINCAAIPGSLMESELFGYSEGSFSGAAKGGKTGKFEQANKGTILLDEIGEMPLELQAKLLRVLQEKEMEKIGSTKTIKLDVQVICATNSNIKEMTAKGLFRKDLYYRINTLEINIPPLRERISDIPLLCEYFIKNINTIHGCYVKKISDRVLKYFLDYNWPGNIRELEHVLERACVLSPTNILDIEHFAFFLPINVSTKDNYSSKQTLTNQKNQFEKEAILKALETTNGNKSKAAFLLKITRSQIYEKIKKYDINYRL